MEFVEHRSLDVFPLVQRKVQVRNHTAGCHYGVRPTLLPPPTLSVRVDLRIQEVNLVDTQGSSTIAVCAPLMRPLEGATKARRCEAHLAGVLAFWIGILRVDLVDVERSAFLVVGTRTVEVRTRWYVVKRPSLRFDHRCAFYSPDR